MRTVHKILASGYFPSSYTMGLRYHARLAKHGYNHSY